MKARKTTNIMYVSKMLVEGSNLKISKIQFVSNEAILNMEGYNCIIELGSYAGIEKEKNYFLGSPKIIYGGASGKVNTIILPSRYGYKESYGKISKVQAFIQIWKNIHKNYELKERSDTRPFLMSEKCKLSNKEKIFWAILKEYGVVQNEVLIEPKLLIFFEADNQFLLKCYQKAIIYNAEWIAPHVCLVDSYVHFIKMLEEAAGHDFKVTNS